MIKFKTADGKHTLEARDEVQVAAFEKEGLKPATKADEAKVKELKGEKVEEE